MSIKAVIEYTDPTDFTFDPSEIEISGGKLQLASRVLASETSFFNFNTDGDNTPTRGVYPIVPEGNVNVQGGFLEFFNNVADKAIIDAAAIPTNKGSIHFKFMPKAAAVIQPTDVIQFTGGLLASHRLFVSNQGGGVSRLNWAILDDAGATVVSTIVLVTLDTINGHDILLNWDLVSGNQRLFLDGVQAHSSTVTGTFTIDGTYEFALGRGASSGNPNYLLDNLQFFSEAIKTDSDPIAFPFPEATPYIAGEFKASLNPAVTMDTINEFTDLTVANGGQIKYLFRFDNVRTYWDGAAWVVSDGTFAQSNAAADISANLATLPISQGVTARLEIFVQTGPDLYITPEAESLIIDYNFFLSSTTPATCDVYGTVKDNSGSPVGGAKITFDTPDHFYGENFISSSVTGFTGADGVFAIAVVETESTGILSTCTIEYKQNGKTIKKTFTGLTIPDDIIARLSDIV